jgi:hypothetical protein
MATIAAAVFAAVAAVAGDMLAVVKVFITEYKHVPDLPMS